MTRTQRVAPQRQAVAHPQLDGEWICNAVDQVRNRVADEGTQNARRDLGRRVVDRHQPWPHRRQLVGATRHLVRLDGQLGAPCPHLERAAGHQT